jgi:fido (protein-threonine AMPylation protein)
MSIARHIQTTMQIELEAVSEEDTLALILGDMPAKSDNAKLVTQMFALMQKEYNPVRPIGEVKLTVARLLEWHAAMFAGIDSFKGKKVGSLRDCGVSVGSRLCPNKTLAHEGLRELCKIVNEFTESAAGKPTTDMENMMRIFALAAFTQYHFLDLHPFKDGNGRMGRFLAKHILESCLPVPFPMYNSREDYFHALRAGDARDQADRGTGSCTASADLLILTVRSAIVHYEALLDYVDRPILVGWSIDTIMEAIRLKSVVCTEDDLATVKESFARLGVLQSETVVLMSGGVQMTKVRPPSPPPQPDEDEVDIDMI